MSGELTERGTGWEVDALLVQSCLLGGIGFAGLSRLLRTWLPDPLALAAGFLLLMLIVFPAVKVAARRRSVQVSARRFVAFTMLGTVFGVVVLLVIGRLI